MNRVGSGRSCLLFLGLLAPADPAWASDEPIALDDGVIVGHLAVFGARTAARRIAQFYATALDAPPELVDAASIQERIGVDARLAASGQLAAEAPFGSLFVAWDDGSLERIEFGVRMADGAAARNPAPAPSASNPNDPKDDRVVLTNGAYAFALKHPESGPALADYLDRHLGRERARSRSERVDVAARLDLARGRDTWAPRWIGLAHLSRMAFARDALVAARFDLLLPVVERILADVDSVELRIGFDSDALRVRGRVVLRSGSAGFLAMGRARSIAPNPPPSQVDAFPRALLEGEIGVDLKDLLSLIVQEEADPASRERFDADFEETRVLVHGGSESLALLVCGAKLREPSPALSTALAAAGARTANDDRRTALGFADDRPQRFLLAVAGEPTRAGGVALSNRIGFVRFSTSGLLRSIGGTAFPPPKDPSLASTCLLEAVESDPAAIESRLEIPRSEWTDMIPRIHVTTVPEKR